MLGYAEVLNEVNGRPTDEAYKMVNDVRKRVGLPELSKTMNHDQFLEAVLRERALELGFEEVRWFDLVRRDRQSDFKKKLYGLRSRGNDLNNPTEFTFEKIELGYQLGYQVVSGSDSSGGNQQAIWNDPKPGLVNDTLTNIV